ncbi:MAG TPA: MFS transporter [Pseudonocardiaceae bacterium]|nr:MFS transporter [Pseudonocardiaceae bacterium]
MSQLATEVESGLPLTRQRLRWVVVVLAVACGLAVANIYYAQPLLALISTSLGVSHGSAALVVTVTQAGYAIGLVVLLPLGDLLENRGLASRTLVVTAAACVAAAFSPNFVVFLAVSVLIGVTSVVAQILIPVAAHLAPEAERGRFVGTVMTGLLLGILLARTVASLVAAAWGWRAIYVVSGVLMLAVSVLLVRVLPRRHPGHHAGYGDIMRSIRRIIREEPALRRRAVCQALLFAAFSSFWTSVAFELVSQHRLSQTGIGIFALVGAAGAGAAPVAGWLGDRGWGQKGSGIALVLGVIAMLVAGFGAGNLLLLGLGAVLLDLAVQGHQVFSQREIYSLRPTARARINTVFMGTIFIGGSIATAVSGALYDYYGWFAVTTFAGALALIGLGIWLRAAQLRRRALPEVAAA